MYRGKRAVNDRLTYNRRDTRAAWLMLTPFLIFFALFVVYPLIMTFYYSLTYNNLKQTGGWAGLAHFRYILTKDRHFKMALKNTFIYAGISIAALTVLGFLAAAALNSATRAVKGMRMLMLFPYATSMTAVAMIWLLLYDKQLGLINKALALLGVARIGWLEDPQIALYSLIFVNIWKNIGYCMLIYLAGMQSVPRELYEAATVDGAGERQKLLHVTLPTIRPVAFFVLITNMVEALKTFDQVRIMTDGNPLTNMTTTIVHQIYLRAFVNDYRRIDEASAMAVVLLMIAFAFTLINYRWNRAADQDGR